MAQYWALTALPKFNPNLTNRKLYPRSAKHILSLLDEEILSADDRELLIKASDEFTLVNHLIRLCVAEPFDPATATSGLIEQLCAALNLPDITSVEAHLADQQKSVAEIFSRTIAPR